MKYFLNGIMNLIFFILLIISYNLSLAQNTIAFDCTTNPIQTSTVRCEGFMNFPLINNCMLPDCGNDDENFCWYVQKPTSMSFVPVSGPNNNASYQTINEDFEINGNTVPGTFVFKRCYSCGNDECNETISQNCKEVTIIVNQRPTITGMFSVCSGSTTQLTGSGAPAINNPWVSSDISKATVNSSGLVNGILPGIVQITFTDVNGCMDSKDVTVYSRPTITGVLSVCAASSRQLIGNGTPAINNPWVSSDISKATVNSSGLVNGISPGIVQITFTDINGCMDTKNVTINPRPTISGMLSVCIGSTTQLFGNDVPSTNNPWVSSDISKATVNSSGLVTGVSQGTTTITFTNANGCIDMKNVTINPRPTISGTLSVCVGSTTQLAGGIPSGNNPWVSSDTTKAKVNLSGLVTGVAQGMVTITFTNVNGCMDTKNIIIHPRPTISGTLSVCVGSTTQLSGSGTAAVNNPWTSSNTSLASVSNTGLITGIAQGFSAITYTNSNGCSDIKNVTIYPLPNASISGLTSICEGSPEFLTASGGTSYVWSDGTMGNTISLSDLSDGDSNFQVTVTDVFGCRNMASYTVEVRNVPKITCNISETTNKGERIFTIDEGSENLFFDSINYQVKKLNGEIILDSTKNNLDPISEFFPSGSLNLSFSIYYKNGCSFSDSSEFIINDENCDNFKPRIKINDISINYNNFKINHYSCDQEVNIFFFEFERINNSLVEIKYDGKPFNLVNNIISIKDTFVTNSNSTKIFELFFDIRSGVAGAFQNNNCNYIIEITNQPIPEVFLEQDTFCHKNEITIEISSGVNNFQCSIDNVPYKTKPDESIIDYINENVSNLTYEDSLIITNIQALNNICKPYDTILYYTILRTPQIDLITDLCKDDNVKNLLIIDNKDLNALFRIQRGVEILNMQRSGIQLDTSSSLLVYAELKHGNIVCPNESTGTVNVNELPEAIIDQFPDGCGPFYQIVNFKSQPDAQFSWKGSSDSDILKITGGPDVIVYSGTVPLILEAEENGCYHRDTVEEVNTTDFSLALQDDVIEGRLCANDTLYYNSTFSDDINCFRWYYINQDGAIVDVSEDENEKPWFKGRDNIIPVLIKSLSCDLCGGIIVSRTVEVKEEDCTESNNDKANDTWNIYPVPVMDFITISSEYFQKGKYEFLLVDAIGRTREEIAIEHPGGMLRKDIFMSDYPEGIYFIKHGDTIKKFVIIK